MPTTDRQILVTGQAPAPAGFTIPGNGQITPKAMNAVFDGTGAASTFLPTLEIVSDGGVVVARCPAPFIAAGGSAEVSWFPWVAGQSVTTIGPGAGCIFYVGPPSGNAARDTAAIQSAHDSLPATGGIVQLCRGSYALTGDPALSFTKPIWLQGHGRKQTLLNYASTTGTAIAGNATGIVFDHFGLINTSGAPATAGAGIHIVGAGNRTEFNRIEVVNFYDGIFKQYGNGCMWDKVTVFGYYHSGIRIQNVTAVDAGDDSITNSQLNANGISGTTAGILWESGGNLRLVGNQLFGGTETDNSCGILLSCLDGVNTSDFLLSANTIEEYEYCIAANLQGLHTGRMQSITAWGNETFKLVNTSGACMSFNMAVANGFQTLSIGGNLLDGGSYGLIFGNVNNITFGPNVYGGNGTATHADAGGSVAVVQVANG